MVVISNFPSSKNPPKSSKAYILHTIPTPLTPKNHKPILAVKDIKAQIVKAQVSHTWVMTGS